MQSTICIVLLVWAVCPLAGFAENTQSSDSPLQDISAAWYALKSGRAFVLMRHALAPGFGDPAEFELGDCSTQRNLSDEGRVQAASMGDVLRANGIAKASLLSSQWCRCMETAMLLNLGDPVPAPMLNSFFQNRGAASEQTQSLHESVRDWLTADTEVRILVSHQVNISALTGQFVNSGGMLIVTMENGEPVVLASIAPQ